MTAFTSLWRTCLLAAWSASLAVTEAADTTSSSSSKADPGPPAFFIQDTADSLCLSGDEGFKRCSYDTLFFVSGDPGNFQIHKRPTDNNDSDTDGKDVDGDGMCLIKQKCNDMTKVEDLKLGKCTHCGAKHWNILGDNTQGYVITATSAAESDTSTATTATESVCLIREKAPKDASSTSTTTTSSNTSSKSKHNKAYLAPCDLTATPTSAADLQYTPILLQFVSAADIASMSSPGARLVTAASDGDKKAIERMLKSGVDVNFRDWDLMTALIPAASAGDLDLCKFLIKEGIDVNAADKDGITSLMEAATMGHTKVVEYLLDNGQADIDAMSKSGVTALYLASGLGNVDVVKALLKRGASANNSRNDGITAIMTASVGGHVEVVKLLLDAGGNVAGSDQDGVTALMNAAEGGNVEVVKVLVAKLKELNDGGTDFLNHVSKTGFTALIIAAAQGRTAAVDYLLDAGADPSTTAESGVTALMYASSHNHLDVMKLLLEKGKVDIDAKHLNDGTALLESCTSGAVEAIKVLLEYGAAVDVRDKDGVSPLMAVGSNTNEEAQRVILDAVQKKFQGQDFLDHMNLFSHSGGSAVMFAAAAGQVQFAKDLIALGAICTKIAKATPEYVERIQKAVEDGTYQGDEPHVDGLTGLHVAAQGGHTEMVKLLLDTGVLVDTADDIGRTPLILAVKGNFGEIATMLVEHGANADTPYTDEKGQVHNLLFDSLMVENLKFAKSLIANGADIYYKDEKGITTLLQACHRGQTEIAEMLIDKHLQNGNTMPGFYIDEASEDGIRPLIAAASEGHVAIVKKLLEAKADANVKDKDDTTALMAASARGHVLVVKELLKAGAEINGQNRDGHTALMFAYNGKNQVETLWERFSQFASSNTESASGGAPLDDGGTGPIIREALDNHTALVDLLLKSGADTKLKDKEGHTAKDFDYHPDTDAELLNKEIKKEALRDGSNEEL